MNPAKMSFNPQKHTIFTPMNKDKYRGEIPIIVRSSWEHNFCKWCDLNNSVLLWSSESLAIQYYDEIKKKNRRYYPDFIMVIKDKEGKEKVYVVEIKPWTQTQPPIRGNKKESTFLNEVATYQTNLTKWNAAEKYCKQHGHFFKILTERDLFK
jgi:hypothetical protein